MMRVAAFIVFYIVLLVNNITSIIRNDITGRCLHIGRLQKGHSATVYASSCTWNSPTTISHPDEWLEIIPSGWHSEEILAQNSRREIHMSSIRKLVTNGTDECLATINNRPGVSHSCSSIESAFSLDVVHYKNFKGSLTSKASIKIRNAAGKCLTVQPGQYVLKFKDCSPRQGLFQVWNICRQNKICDVEATWSPQPIIFPTNASRTESMSDRSTTNTNNPTYVDTTVTKDCQKDNIEDSVKPITNEVLYTVQNAARLYSSHHHFMIDGIVVFYAKEHLIEAQQVLLSLCQTENSKCMLCTERDIDQNLPKSIVSWLINWMVECNAPSPNQKIFLSRDVYQVPHYLFFPSHDPSGFKELSLAEKYKLVIANLRKYMTELEKVFSALDTAGVSAPQNVKVIDTDSGKTESSSEHQQKHSNTEKLTENMMGNNQFNETTEITSASEITTNATQDYASIIDIRLSNG